MKTTQFLDRINRINRIKERLFPSCFHPVHPVKKFFYVVFAIFVVSSRLSAFAQVTQAWVAKYNNGILNGTNQAVKMALDAAGNVYVTGFSQNATNGNLDYATIKYSPTGNQVWAARFVATNTTTAKPTGLVLDSNTNAIVTGSSCTVKYDNNGTQLWAAPYAGYMVAVDSSNNVFVPGSQAAFGEVKLNPGGTNLWETQQAISTGQSISVDSAGNSYVAGSDGFSSAGQSYFYLTVTENDPNGNQLWIQQQMAGADFGFPVIRSTTLDNSNNFYVLLNDVRDGQAYETWKFAASTGNLSWEASAPPIYGAYDANNFASAFTMDKANDTLVTGIIYVITNIYDPPEPGAYGTFKLNTNGAYIGTNLYPTVPVGNSVATSIAVDQANSAYVTGYSPGTNSGNDIVTIKYDNNGNQIWLQRYNGPGNGDDEGNAIAVDALGNVYVTGYETTAAGGTEMVTIKYAPAASIQKQGNGSILLQEQGEPGRAFDFQASSNLQTWLDLGTTNADTNGLVQFLDTNAPNYTNRFYLTLPQ